MTPETETNETYEPPDRPTDPIAAARAYGIDISMLTDNLDRSVVERLRRHEAARRTASALRKADT